MHPRNCNKRFLLQSVHIIVVSSLWFVFQDANAFVIHSKRTTILLKTTYLFSSNYNNNNNDNEEQEDDRMQQLRTLLEASWNPLLMGNIPTTPTAAANEIAQCMSSSSSYCGGICIIDLQLPSLDLRQGTRWYDAVLTADLAHILVERLWQQKHENVDVEDSDALHRNNNGALLLVRDQATVRTIERVWSTRVPSSSLNDVKDDDDEPDEDEDEEEHDDLQYNDTTIVYDDFADFGFVESIAAAVSPDPTSNNKNNVDAQQLPSSSTSPVVRRRIQLKSLFADATISEGADMEEQVIRALQVNVVNPLKQQEEDRKEGGEYKTNVDTIVMIAPVTRPEVVAIRALVQKYSKHKQIVLLNPQFAKPRPLELQQAQTVYSLRPFLVRAKPSQKTLTKLVILKRSDEWELFVSNSNENGRFERLAVNLPKGMDAMDGPSMEWVAACAEQYLQRNGNRKTDL